MFDELWWLYDGCQIYHFIERRLIHSILRLIKHEGSQKAADTFQISSELLLSTIYLRFYAVSTVSARTGYIQRSAPTPVPSDSFCYYTASLRLFRTKSQRSQ